MKVATYFETTNENVSKSVMTECLTYKHLFQLVILNAEKIDF